MMELITLQILSPFVLYDIAPPTIFLLSLGGIVVIMARVMVRMRRAEFSADMKSAAVAGRDEGSWSRLSTPQAADVLRPTQKSVHAIRSRAALVGGWFQHALAQIAAAPGALVAKIRERRQRPDRPADTVDQSLARDRSNKTEEVELRSAAPAPTEATIVEPRRRFQGLGQRWQGMKSRASALRRQRADNKASVEQASPAAEPNLDKLLQTQPPAKPRRIKTRLVAKPTPAPDKSTPNPTVDHNPLSAFRRTHRPSASASASPLQQARQALTNQEYQRAEDLLVDYIVQHTKDTKAYMLLGQVAIAKENWNEAMEIFEQVVAWRPEEEGAYAGLGISAYRCGKYGRALQALQRAIDADPDNLPVLESLLAIAKKMDNPALQHSVTEKLKELEQQSQRANAH